MTVQEVRDIIGFDASNGFDEIIGETVCKWVNSLGHTGWEKYTGCTVHMTGSIWVENPDEGHWLSDDEVLEFWAWHKARTDDSE